MNARRRNRGVALITAMLITALASMVAANLAWDNAIDVRRTMVQLNRDQAIQVAIGAESWVSSILRDDLANSETDHLGEIWASDLPGLPIDGGEVFGRLEDLQGRFNINNLVDGNGEPIQQYVDQFRRLLQVLELDPRFAGLAVDWLDADQDASFPDGAEDAIYTGMLPPYRSADQFLTSISEIAALEGMNKESFNRLAPLIMAIPGREPTPINVNTALPAVLQSLDENLRPADIESLISERELTGFADYQNTFSSLVSGDMLDTLDESTSFFQLQVVVRIDTVRITLYSILQRSQQGDVTPILRSLGTI